MVKAVDSQSKVPDSNLLVGFTINIISAFHLIEVDEMSSRTSWGLTSPKQTDSLWWPCSLETVESHR